jgi:biopolymer transport protein ExbD
LQAGARNGSEQKIYLRVRARAKYGDAKAVLHQIRTTGIESAALLSQDTRHETAP